MLKSHVQVLSPKVPNSKLFSILIVVKRVYTMSNLPPEANTDNTCILKWDRAILTVVFTVDY